MQEGDIMAITRHAILIALELSLPIMVATLIIGVMISLFQAVTQIQEQSLSFVPKILIISAALVLLGPWMLHSAVGFMGSMISSLPSVPIH